MPIAHSVFYYETSNGIAANLSIRWKPVLNTLNSTKQSLWPWRWVHCTGCPNVNHRQWQSFLGLHSLGTTLLAEVSFRYNLPFAAVRVADIHVLGFFFPKGKSKPIKRMSATRTTQFVNAKNHACLRGLRFCLQWKGTTYEYLSLKNGNHFTHLVKNFALLLTAVSALSIKYQLISKPGNFLHFFTTIKSFC